MKGSVYQNEQELLKAIIDIHCPQGIELDPMYFKGNFYKEIPKPDYYYDINPLSDDILGGDATNLHWIKDNTINSMILDPPFMFGIHGQTKNYYSSRTHGILKNFNALGELYSAIIQEAYRILKPNGILIFKCQDYTDSKTTMTHCLVFNWAVGCRFYAKDLAILWLPKNKIYNSKLKQRHFRKTHSYFWVFKKTTKLLVKGEKDELLF